jgi:hypothetical protein
MSITTRFYRRKSTGDWFHRIDHNIGASIDDCVATVAESFGVPGADVQVREVETTEAQRDALRLAPRWKGTTAPQVARTGGKTPLMPQSRTLSEPEMTAAKVTALRGRPVSQWTNADRNLVLSALIRPDVMAIVQQAG